MKRGVLLANIGSPEAPTTGAVRAYLQRFLSDPRILGMPAFVRIPLVYGFIAPLRAPKSAAAYRKVWTPAGSPLTVHGEALAAAIGGVYATRYGRPTFAEAIDKLGEVDEIVVLPLFPQYAAATSGSVMDGIGQALAGRPKVPAIRVIPPFWSDAGFLDAVAAAAKPTIAETRPDRIVFSFHGLPESQAKAACERHDSAGACCRAQAPSPFCYRAQCVETARRVASRLGVEGEPIVCFQSRLGPATWIGPSTLDTLDKLAAEGVKRVVVLTPAFVADCLETLEEIGMGAREHFIAKGGEELRVAPCVNTHPRWVEAVKQLTAG